MNVLLVYDVEGWAFHNWALGILNNYSGEHTVSMMSNAEYGSLFDSERLPRTGQYDAIFLMSWNECPTKKLDHQRISTLVASPGLMWPYPSQNPEDLKSLISTPIRCCDNAWRIAMFNSVLCTTKEIYCFCHDLNCNSERVGVGVDTSVYRPQKVVRDGSKFRVGWCGQNNPTKGLEYIVKPLMEMMPEVEFDLNERDYTQSLGQEEMALWYSSLDLFLTTGCAEGGPSPPLEAISCGTPVVGTNSGTLLEVVKNGYNGYLIKSYRTKAEARDSVHHLKHIIEDVIKSNETPKLSVGARKTAEEKLCWKHHADHWVNTICGDNDDT